MATPQERSQTPPQPPPQQHERQEQREQHEQHEQHKGESEQEQAQGLQNPDQSQDHETQVEDYSQLQQQQQQQQQAHTSTPPVPASAPRDNTPPVGTDILQGGSANHTSNSTASVPPVPTPASTGTPRGNPVARSRADAASRGEVSAIAYKLLSFEMIQLCDDQDDLGKLEMLGYDIGHRFVERFTRHHTKFTSTLEVVKFLCKDLWAAMFGKQVDKLQTNHKGVFVLHDNSFTWTTDMIIDYDDQASLDQAKKLLIVPCGLIRGALSNLGIKCTVRAEFSTLPICYFNIQINEEL